MAKILKKYKRLEEEIRRDIECLGGSSRPGSPMNTSPGRKRGNRVETRFLSILDSAGQGISLTPLSALERRAGAARSGPKAAKCPTCPKKNPPPKKTVPRSKAQPKPKPAVKPRQPAKAPQPRKPSPAKKVTPRPAVSRATGSSDALLTNSCRHARAAYLESQSRLSVQRRELNHGLFRSRPASQGESLAHVAASDWLDSACISTLLFAIGQDCANKSCLNIITDDLYRT